jgi:hypothetical protein
LTLPLDLPRALAESQVDVAVDLLETVPQLLDPVHRVLDAAGQFAHLGFQSVHAQLGIDRPCRPSADHRGRAATVNLPLQHAEIPLQAIQAVLHRPVLRACRRDRQDHDDERQEHDRVGRAQDQTPYHQKPLETAREPGRFASAPPEGTSGAG